MKGILKLPIIIWTLLTLAAYVSVLVSPEFFKYSGVVSLAIPFIILGNILWVGLALFTKPKAAVIPFVLLIIGYSFVTATISLDGKSETPTSFQVMNYNMMRMNKLNKEKDQTALIEWLSSNPSDIMCFQEFLGTQKIIGQISNKGALNSFVGGYGNSYAIFSKYPIINKGVFYEGNVTNNILFADLKIGADTIRVYNVHLQSMSINVDQEVIDKSEFDKNYETVRRKFQEGSVRRTAQIKDLIAHTQKCSYPILIVGDFNDTPYSYNYYKVSRSFNNAFEYCRTWLWLYL